MNYESEFSMTGALNMEKEEHLPSRGQAVRYVYLKVNFLAPFVFRNVQRWVDAFEVAKSVRYFLVYNSEVMKGALEKAVRFQGSMAGFIPVNQSEAAGNVVRNTCKENWHNAAFMHLTPFFHAASNGIEKFWSIDADVCHVCLSGQRTWRMLESASIYAEEQGTDLFSLDIWQSLTKYLHNNDLWTFGIAYVRGNKNVLEILQEHLTDEAFAKVNKVHVDIYFNYLSACGLKIGSFYFENLQFVLYGNDFFAKPCSTGLYKYGEGKIMFPFLYYCIGEKSRGCIPIADNVVKLDIDITKREGSEALAACSMVQQKITFSEKDFIDGSMGEKMFFYLKINRREPYVFRNLQHWVRIVECYPNADYCIVCDHDWLKDEVLKRVSFKNHQPVFITSISNEELKYISEAVCNDYWQKAAWAHMTTFCHAKVNGIKRFWNIDADDTLFCLAPDRVAALLHMVENYADKEDMSIISLDMWWSYARGNHWSFGVTYTDGDVDWLEYMTKHCHDETFDYTKGAQNLDSYFTYLSRLGDIRMGTFYGENLKFIHYWNDFLEFPFARAGMSHWKNGYIHYPIVEYCIGAKEFGKVPIAKGCVKFDMDITDEETTEFLSGYAEEYFF